MNKAKHKVKKVHIIKDKAVSKSGMTDAQFGLILKLQDEGKCEGFISSKYNLNISKKQASEIIDSIKGKRIINYEKKTFKDVRYYVKFIYV